MSQALEANKSSRNQRMDLYRGLAAYGVIFMHVPFPGKLGTLVRTLSLFGVPFFFLTAGYFSFELPPERAAGRALRTLRQLVLACVPYFLLGCALALSRGESPAVWLRSLCSFYVLRELLFFQIVPLPYAWQLWFLGALLLVYLIWFWITVTCKKLELPPPYDALALAAAVLLGIHLILGEGAGLTGTETPAKYLRNALLDGLPFFLLGMFGKAREAEIQKKKPPWIGIIIGGFLLSVAEAGLAGRQELYLGTLIALAGLTGRSICRPEVQDNAVSRAVQFCGRELTLYIFTIHLLIIGVIREAPQLQGLSAQESILPLIVALLSTLAALACHQLRKQL